MSTPQQDLGFAQRTPPPTPLAGSPGPCLHLGHTYLGGNSSPGALPALGASGEAARPGLMPQGGLEHVQLQGEAWSAQVHIFIQGICQHPAEI